MTLRKIIVLIIGLALAFTGGWFLFKLLTEATRINGLFVLGAGFMGATGVFVAWDIIEELIKKPRDVNK